MKYLTFHSGHLKPLVVLFSSDIEHVEMAKRVGLPVVGAGFAAVDHATVRTAGVSTSLFVGPHAGDAAAIEYEMIQTVRNYPPPPQPKAAEILSGAPVDVSSLTPEEQAAWRGETAPERCYSCGRLLTAEVRDKHNPFGPVCSACDEAIAERATRSNRSALLS